VEGIFRYWTRICDAEFYEESLWIAHNSSVQEEKVIQRMFAVSSGRSQSKKLPSGNPIHLIYDAISHRLEICAERMRFGNFSDVERRTRAPAMASNWASAWACSCTFRAQEQSGGT
jgi:hypothetical protein